LPEGIHMWKLKYESPSSNQSKVITKVKVVADGRIDSDYYRAPAISWALITQTHVLPLKHSIFLSEIILKREPTLLPTLYSNYTYIHSLSDKIMM
jgi:hypothetical protein